MKFEHKLGLIVGSVAAPGFAQAVLRRWRVALIWLGLEVAFTLLATRSVWMPIAAIVLRVGAGVSAYLETRRTANAPTWWWTMGVFSVLAAGLGALGLLKASVGGYRIPTSSMYPTLVIGDHIFVDKLSVLWRAPERGEVIVFRFPCDERIDYVKRVIAVGGDTVEVRCSVVYVNGKAIESQPVVTPCTYRDRDDTHWYEHACSRYRETHGGHRYEVFYDVERPNRDRQGDARTAGDPHDFPQRDRMFAPACTAGDLYDHKIVAAAAQPRGRIELAKPDAKTCEPQLHFVVPPDSLFMLSDNRDNANDSRYWGVVPVDAAVGRAIGIWINDPPGADRDWGRLGGIE